jgi:hypothetical protein
MANDVATTNDAPTLAVVVDQMFKAIEREKGQDFLPAPPAASLRKQMEARHAEIRTALRPISMARAEQERAAKIVAGLLGAYTNLKTANPQALVAGYVAHLAEQPLFAIIAACDDFKHGRVYDIGSEGQRIPFTLDHAPSAFRLLDQVKKRAADLQGERYRIGRVLCARQAMRRAISEDEAQRVAAGMATLASDFGLRLAVERKENVDRTRREAQEARDRARRITEDATARRRAAGTVAASI